MDLTIGISLYNIPCHKLEEIFSNFYNYPDNVEIIVVDDCSKRPVHQTEGRLLKHKNLRLLRILNDIPWNLAGVRNLIFDQAKSDWVMIIDADHMAAPHHIKYLLDMYKERGTQYIFKRDRPDKPFTEAGNVQLLHKLDYELIGGWDEDFVGYGGKDTAFMTLARRRGINLKCIDDFTLLYDDSIKNTTLVRNAMENEYLAYRKLQDENYRPKNHLRFAWEEVIL